MQNIWLMKSEPEEVSIDDALAAPQATVGWFGVRNYQARNYMRDQMQIGDRVLFYHSSCAEPGVVGLAKVKSAAYPDPTQFDPHSPYYDRLSKPGAPRWVQVDVQALRKIGPISLIELRRHPALREMRLLARGNRLSITPVTPAEFTYIRDRWIS